MERKIQVGVIGATGMVGQKFLTLLKDHPWFEVVYLAASPQSAGKKYADAVAGRWHMDEEIPPGVRDIGVENASDVAKASGRCRLVFSAVEMDKQAILALEMEYAGKGVVVVSNNSAHRSTPDVPVMIPEINPGHLDIIPAQKKHYGWDRGFLVVKPNCSIQSYMLPVYALMKAGYAVDRIIVTTLQAVSGAGYPGPASVDLIDNVVPFISGEEEKSEDEPRKIFGRIIEGKIDLDTSIKISAHCNRVLVTDGHIACVSLGFARKKPEMPEVIAIWRSFTALPQELKLPSAPVPPIIYRDEINRPQPRKDRDAGKGMAVTVGRLRKCNVLDYRFIGLHHNTVRGAAGGAVITAELLVAKGFVK
ncbi:MAG: aspartate-semialdehyde dehydrogenase [Chloroflexi bacterium RBG_16_56_11]|nr:MAG: aspartate-semialdehyde dehydrogenase [Chloroflexi bacterium RBG_16_56_11]